MRLAIIAVLVCACAGCVTYRDKVGIVRGSKFAEQEGSPTGQAVGRELRQVGLDVGAYEDVDPATVVVSAEAADENAAGIEAERNARQAIWAKLKAGVQWVADATGWGWLAGALGAAGTALTWLKKRKAQLESKEAGEKLVKSEEILGIAARAVNSLKGDKASGDDDLSAVLDAETPGMRNVNRVDVADALNKAAIGEI